MREYVNERGVKGNALDWARRECIDRERWRSICHGHPLEGRSWRERVIRNNKSKGKEVTSGVPQGSVLAPIIFAVYINDMTEGVTSYMNMFADNAKILTKVTKEEDCTVMPSVMISRR